MDLQLNGKTAIVTAATAGIGFAIARTLAREGAEVTITGRDREKLAAAVDEINAAAPLGKIHGFLADISTVEGVEALTSQLEQVDILVNNLGYYEPRTFPGSSHLPD
ncbi:SDR family NAD(P)-dependent oxidoreductase [Enterobacter sp. Bisph1]|uniref:SDR family NAD(P)-dependent oxidoreductase n=1 Tax=Enterobacter sp. Bisph1 TaxID=1274399 RepID=UPI0009E2DDA5|nr:SDR family NAD(P)-dependent oxidoreductase [Enterobacter sp. Bisph1]